MTLGPELPIPGVTSLEHTADVGLEVEAPSLSDLFRRGALGAMWLVLEREPGVETSGEVGRGWSAGSGEREGPMPAGSPFCDPETRRLELAEEDLPALFRAWLRALLFWEETEGFVTRDAAISFAPVPFCSSEDGQAFGLTARVEGLVDPGPRVREIKGVTLHELRVYRVGGTWRGRVVFDV